MTVEGKEWRRIKKLVLQAAVRAASTECFLSQLDVCAVLNISDQRLRDLIREEAFPVGRFNGAKRAWLRSEVIEWARQCPTFEHVSTYEQFVEHAKTINA